jgi:asparagine synthase (glutamine-hydrolysing)
MCGVAGEITAGGQSPAEARDRVAGMIAAMEHRGPDDAGFREGEGAVLGMCRLAIIDVAGGAQPISTADGRYHIIYNGECYGVESLRRELAGRGHRFRTRTDTEVVLAAYVEWGAAGLARLNGMFAFAIWDSLERELFLARDRLGIKPLFYAPSGDRLVFSSTLGAILGRGDVDPAIDPEAVELYLSLKFVTAPHTIARAVRKLPAGHWARWRDGALEVRRWWQVPLGAEAPRNPEVEVAELLADAARIRLVSERPVGLCLSGGIDSGLIASALAGTDTATFSLGFDDPSYDESAVAGRVARHVGLPHHILRADHGADIDADFAAVIEHYDEPVGDPSGMALFALSRLVAEHVTVVLSGSGGDELFGGYQRYLAGLLARLTQHVPGLDVVSALLGRDESKTGWRKRLGRFAAIASAPPLDAYRGLLAPAAPDIQRRWRTQELERAVAGFSAGAVFEEHFARTEGASLLSRLMVTDLETVLVDDYLVKEDRMTMAHSIEGRVPFLDHRLVELAFSLPDREKIRGLTTKVLLRRLARDRLPKEVARAPKQGFEIPVASWLRGPLAGRLRAALEPPGARLYEYVDRVVVDRLREDHARERADHGRALWALLTLQTWFDHADRHRHS